MSNSTHTIPSLAHATQTIEALVMEYEDRL